LSQKRCEQGSEAGVYEASTSPAGRSTVGKDSAGRLMVGRAYPGAMANVRSKTPVRALWLVIAVASLSLGAVGVVVPVLPTTPFLLLAAYAAARSSTRLHAWLVGHRLFGPLITDWQANHTVSRRAKATATATMTASAVVLFVVGPSTWLALAVTALMATVATWLWLRPEPTRS